MRVFRHYLEWEDWRCGMYRTVSGNQRDLLVRRAAQLLREHICLGQAMYAVIHEWPVSTLVNLSDRSSNRRAWMGQAACCLEVGAPEDVTREAWGLLTPKERSEANVAADATIEYWGTGIGCQRDIWPKAS